MRFQLLFALIFYFVCFTFPFHTASAQTFQKTYGATGDDQAQFVLETPAGYLIAGSATPLGSNQPDAYLLEIDKKGTLLWQQAYGGSQKDIFMAVIAANDGGYIAIGETWSFGAGQQDLFVMKVETDGQVVWCKTFGGQINDYARSILAIPGGYIISGPQYSLGAGGLDAYFIRLDNQGNEIYSKTVGSSLDDQIQAVYLQSNVLYAGGGVKGEGSFLTLDVNTCQVLSAVSYGGSGTEALYRCLPTPDGNFILADHTWTSTGGLGLRQWAMKVKPDGTPIWSKVYCSSDSNFRGGVEVDPNGGYILTPWDFANPTSTDGMLIRIDENGEVIWANRYGGNSSDRFFKSLPTSDGGYISVGHTKSSGAGGDDIFVVKMDDNGLLSSCCPRPLTVESQNFLPSTSFPNLVVNDFGNAKTWNISSRDIAPFVLETCTSDLPHDTRQIYLCSGEAFLLHGQAFYTPQIVFDTILNPFGCDSAIEYRLLPRPTPKAAQSATICPGGSVTLHGVSYTQPGIYLDTIPATTGCDTALTITIFTKALIPAAQSATICPGGSVTLHGVNYTQPGIYSDTIAASTGCDTALTITIIMNPGVTTIQQSATICPGESVMLYGQVYSQPGTYTDTLPAISGQCDTLVTLTIFRNSDTLFLPEAHIRCMGDTLHVYGAILTQTGTYDIEEASVVACVLIHRVTLQIMNVPAFDVQISPAGCGGKSIGAIEVKGVQADWEARLDGGKWAAASLPFTQLPPGSHLIEVRNKADCTAAKQVTVPEEKPFLLNLRVDTTQAECGWVNASVSHTSKYPVALQWQPPGGVDCPTCPKVELRPDGTQVYQVLAVDSAGCVAIAQVKVAGGEVFHLYAPNVFSPNDDGLNDRFTLYGSRCARLIRRLAIYDRWGGLVFDRQNLPLGEEAEGWDGYARSQLVTPGVFAWWAQVELLSGRLILLEGSVTVVR